MTTAKNPFSSGGATKATPNLGKKRKEENRFNQEKNAYPSDPTAWARYGPPDLHLEGKRN